MPILRVFVSGKGRQNGGDSKNNTSGWDVVSVLNLYGNHSTVTKTKKKKKIIICQKGCEKVLHSFRTGLKWTANVFHRIHIKNAPALGLSSVNVLWKYLMAAVY